MKYEAINNRIIVKKPENRKTESGIILSEQKEGQVFELEVVATTEQTKRLQGRTILAEPRMVREFPTTEAEHYGSMSIDDVLGVISK